MKALILVALVAGIVTGSLVTSTYMSTLIPYQPQDTKLMDACLSAWQSRMKRDNDQLAELAGLWGKNVRDCQQQACRK